VAPCDVGAEVSQAFVDAYFEAARGGSFCPADRADADQVVHFVMLEKALDEISYELANRPEWATIPLVGSWGFSMWRS
jgi:maltose alpha-D-glucosyltransferase / alpha-amylase